MPAPGTKKISDINDAKAEFAKIIAKASLPDTTSRGRTMATAITNGVAKSDKKKDKEAKQRDKEIAASLGKLRVELAIGKDEDLRKAAVAFINGPLKQAADAFMVLFVTKQPNPDGIEAATALEACRVAFDACGLILSDVETRAPKSAPKAEKAPKSKPTKPEKKAKKTKKEKK